MLDKFVKMPERAWVEAFKLRLEPELRQLDAADQIIKVGTERWLYYAQEVMGHGAAQPNPENTQYRVDLVIYDRSDGINIPRVAIECKMKAVSTNDALAYGEKARRHRLVYPHLRYGILLAGGGSRSLSGSLVREVRDMDFLFMTAGMEFTEEEWSSLVHILCQEVDASRRLQSFLVRNRKADKTCYRQMHRPLVLS